MEQSKRERLQAEGWSVGGVSDFLDLSREEAEFIEMKLALSHQVRHRRQQQRLTQEEVAQMTGSSQSRVAKMEAGDASVSIDLLMKTLIAMGASRREIAESIGSVG